MAARVLFMDAAVLGLDLLLMPLCMMHLWNEHLAPFLGVAEAPFLTMLSIRVMLMVGIVSLFKLRLRDIKDEALVAILDRMTRTLERVHEPEGYIAPDLA